MSGAELRAREYLRIINAKYFTGQQPASRPTHVVMARRHITDLLAEMDKLRETLESHGPEGHNATNKQVSVLRDEIAKLREVSRIALQLKKYFDDGAWIENGGFDAGLVADDLWAALEQLSGNTGELGVELGEVQE